MASEMGLEVRIADLRQRLRTERGAGWHPYAVGAAQIASEAIEALATPATSQSEERAEPVAVIKYDKAVCEVVQQMLERGKVWVDSQGYLRLFDPERPYAEDDASTPADPRVVALVEALERVASLQHHSREDDAENAQMMEDIATAALAAFRGEG